MNDTGPELNEPALRPQAAPDGFAVSAGMRMFGYLCHEFPRIWTGIERIESSLLRDQLGEIAIEAPIFVAGLARSGTTILLELLADLPATATHRYRDFPPIWTPYLWDRFLQLVPRGDVVPHERPHGDGIEITPDSPEAMEEAIWMRFFPTSHDPSVSNRLGRNTRNQAFADFYRRHIQKLLLVRGGRRYVAKGNYNIARLEYIQELFPDARFVVPVRHPVSHIASLMRQHRRFTRGEEAHAPARAYLRRVGHFEFGLDRAPLNMGDANAMRDILARWDAGDEVGGWARYWSHVYGAVKDRLDQDDRLREAALVVRYEDLNAGPGPEILRLLNHCRLDVDARKIAEMSARLHRRDYYANGLGRTEERRILDVVGPVMAHYGYTTSRTPQPQAE